MSLPVYLAMTAAEFADCQALPRHPGWMACHFSPYGTGLSNLPETLPPGALLILNDRIPLCGHDPEVICRQLADAVEKFGCSGLLLDLQRQAQPQAARLVRAIADVLPCPVAVTEHYAGELDCPVLLPAPLFETLESLLDTWSGREIWLEPTLCRQTATVTKAGCRFGPVTSAEPVDSSFAEPKLCCRYCTRVFDEQIEFTLFRTPACISDLLNKAEALGIPRAVGLYQELGGCLAQS